MDIADQNKAFHPGRLKFARPGTILALVPRTMPHEMNLLANRLVRDPDRFRENMSDEEIVTKRAAKPGLRQEGQLLKRDYPYVFEDFKFHLTLTGALDANIVKDVSWALDKHLEPLVTNAFTLFGCVSLRRAAGWET